MDDNQDSEMRNEDNLTINNGTTDLEIEDSDSNELEEGEIVDDSDSEDIEILPLPANRKRKSSSEVVGSFKESRTTANKFVDLHNVEFVEKHRVHRKPPMRTNRFEGLDSNGNVLRLHSDVKVEIVVDPNRPRSVQSDDSFSDSECYQSIFRPIKREGFEDAFTSRVMREESPVAGPSRLTAPHVANTVINSRKRTISNATSVDKRSRTSTPSFSPMPNILPPPAHIPQKSYGYFVPSSQPSYSELLNFYKRSVAAASFNPFHYSNGYFVPSTQPTYDQLLQFYKRSLVANAANSSHAYNNVPPVVFTPDASMIQYNKILEQAYREAELSNDGTDYQD